MARESHVLVRSFENPVALVRKLAEALVHPLRDKPMGQSLSRSPFGIPGSELIRIPLKQLHEIVPGLQTFGQTIWWFRFLLGQSTQEVRNRPKEDMINVFFEHLPFSTRRRNKQEFGLARAA